MKKPQEYSQYRELMEAILMIEKELLITIDQTNSENVLYCLNNRAQMLTFTSKMVEDATFIYETAKGEVAELIIVDDKLLNVKQGILSKFIEGKMAEHTALYARAERCWKMLDKNIQALVSVLSFNKELIKSDIKS